MAEYRIQGVLSFVCRTLVFITRINSVYLFLANITVLFFSFFLFLFSDNVENLFLSSSSLKGNRCFEPS